MMKIKNKNINRGAALVSLVFALLFFILLVRFLHIQITGKVDGQVLAAIAEERYTEKRSIEARRGSILDRTGEEIALDTPAYTVVAILDEGLTLTKSKPRHVVDPQETAQKLAPLLNMDEAEVEDILLKDKKQVEFGSKGRDISYSLKQQIEELELPGIAFIRDYKRNYPNGTFASNVVGYAQKKLEEDNTQIIDGQLGLEKSLNEFLKEEDGYLTYHSDKKGFQLPDAKEQIVSPDNGSNVYLTIDKKIQTFLEDSMNKVVEEYEPAKVIGIVADPKTGEILAMGTRPSFDPNVRNISNYLNDAVSYRFEPGSTMKIFTLAAAIEEGVFNGEETYQSGRYAVPGSSPIGDHNHGAGWGRITFLEGVQRSSNVALAILANEKLGTDRLKQYLDRFGLSEPTGIDLEGEVDSLINFNSERDKISTAFGQASAITPIQQIQAATAIANGGKMMQPYIVDKIVDPDNDEVLENHQPIVKGNPISAETAKKVLDILETVVTEGTGKIYQLEGYDVAGKTGTAQIADPKGGYLSGHGNNVFSFLGMAPKDDPRLIVYVAVQQPKLEGFQTGAEPVSAIFNPVMKNSLQYLSIQPSAANQEQESSNKLKHGITLESYLDRSNKKANDDIVKQGLQPIFVGDGQNVIDQMPKAGSTVLKGERIILITDGTPTMPDISGWSLRDTVKLIPLLQLKSTIKGNGYVINQSIAPGAPIKKGDLITLEFSVPNNEASDEEVNDNELVIEKNEE